MQTSTQKLTNRSGKFFEKKTPLILDLLLSTYICQAEILLLFNRPVNEVLTVAQIAVQLGIATDITKRHVMSLCPDKMHKVLRKGEATNLEHCCGSEVLGDYDSRQVNKILRSEVVIKKKCNAKARFRSRFQLFFGAGQINTSILLTI